MWYYRCDAANQATDGDRYGYGYGHGHGQGQGQGQGQEYADDPTLNETDDAPLYSDDAAADTIDQFTADDNIDRAYYNAYGDTNSTNSPTDTNTYYAIICPLYCHNNTSIDNWDPWTCLAVCYEDVAQFMEKYHRFNLVDGSNIFLPATNLSTPTRDNGTADRCDDPCYLEPFHGGEWSPFLCAPRCYRAWTQFDGRYFWWLHLLLITDLDLDLDLDGGGDRDGYYAAAAGAANATTGAMDGTPSLQQTPPSNVFAAP